MPGNHNGWKKKFDKFNFEDNQIAVAAIENYQTATATANANTGVVITKKRWSARNWEGRSVYRCQGYRRCYRGGRGL